MKSKIKQLGFTLMELTVALGLIVVISLSVVSISDTNRTRAELLHQKMGEVAGGLLRMKTDVACYPSKLMGMVNPTDGSDTFCGQQSSSNWKGPYTAVGTTFGHTPSDTGDMVFEQISPELTVYLDEVILSPNTNGNDPSNATKSWILKTRGLTEELQTQFLNFCSKELDTGKPTGRCFKEPNNQVGYLVDADKGYEQYYPDLITPVVVPDPCKGATCVKDPGTPVVTQIDTGCPPGGCPTPTTPVTPITPTCETTGTCPCEYYGNCPIIVPPVTGTPLTPVNNLSNPQPAINNSNHSMQAYTGSDGQMYQDAAQTVLCGANCAPGMGLTDLAQASRDAAFGVPTATPLVIFKDGVQAVLDAMAAALQEAANAVTGGSGNYNNSYNGSNCGGSCGNQDTTNGGTTGTGGVSGEGGYSTANNSTSNNTNTSESSSGG